MPRNLNLRSATFSDCVFQSRIFFSAWKEELWILSDISKKATFAAVHVSVIANLA